LDSSIVQGPFSVAPCQTLANITIRNFFIAVWVRLDSRPVSARPATGRTHQRRGTSVPSYVELRARTLAEQRQLAAGVKLDLVTAWDNPLAVKERYRVEHWVPPGGLYLPAGLASASDGGGGWEDEPLVTPAAGNFTITGTHTFTTSGTRTLMIRPQLHHVDESTPTAPHCL
jgi:hypothetical protein